jgi:hypothetical protein
MSVFGFTGGLFTLGLLNNLTRSVVWREIAVGFLSGFLGTLFYCFISEKP